MALTVTDMKFTGRITQENGNPTKYNVNGRKAIELGNEVLKGIPVGVKANSLRGHGYEPIGEPYPEPNWRAQAVTKSVKANAQAQA